MTTLEIALLDCTEPRGDVRGVLITDKKVIKVIIAPTVKTVLALFERDGFRWDVLDNRLLLRVAK